MHLYKSGGYKYIVQACCSLTQWPEYQILQKENGKSIAQFLFNLILCRWGTIVEITMDNGPPFLAALDYLQTKYNIRHIRVSGYNSQSHSAIEVAHRPVWEALIKSRDGDIRGWHKRAPYVFWAERISIKKATGLSPFYMAHGIKPLLPFDITMVTYLLPDITTRLSDGELLGMQARQLERRGKDLAQIHEWILKSHFASISKFEKRHKNTIIDYNFQPGEFVLVSNKKIEPEVGRKGKPRYFGPIVVAVRLQSGAYWLAELNGALAKNKYATFWIIPYYRRSQKSINITEIINNKDLASINTED